ncbi:hypothetical protein [Aureimonas glaciei]|nr:hypothetical protein [Aureimonas glaciei]
MFEGSDATSYLMAVLPQSGRRIAVDNPVRAAPGASGAGRTRFRWGH